jgi:hypothetical protein
MPSSNDAFVEQAAFEFWGAITEAFPEFTGGESQLSGECEAAFGIWLFQNPGDNPVHETDSHLSVPAWVSKRRIRRAIEAGIARVAAAYAATTPEVPAGEPSSEVFAQLEGCVRHILHYNVPSRRERLVARQAAATAHPDA